MSLSVAEELQETHDKHILHLGNQQGELSQQSSFSFLDLLVNQLNQAQNLIPK